MVNLNVSYTSLLAVFTLTIRNSGGSLLSPFGPPTVPELNVHQYSGRWYQTYSSYFPNITFEKNGYCVTADYGVISNSSISVVNAQAQGSANGELEIVDGTATVVDPKHPGKLSLVFNDRNQFLPGFYWIVALGPVVNNKYEWSVVSAPFRLALFILARDVDKFRSTYEKDVLARVHGLGFTWAFNKPLPTYQDALNCHYLDRVLEVEVELGTEEEGCSVGVENANVPHV